MVCMSADTFAEKVLAHRRATIHAVKYAKHFCWRMDREEAVCDMTGFDLHIAVLDDELYIGGLDSHFVFLSHYKVEAGTEANLMKHALEVLIRSDASNPGGDFKSPVFVDTDDLSDLA